MPLAPSERQEFSEDAEIVLARQLVGELLLYVYLAVTLAYAHLQAAWYDEVPWTGETSWTLSEHGYLLDLFDDGQYRSLV